MNKLLLKQIWNERRSNAWMWTELLLVSVVMWFIVDTMYVKLHTYFEPRGFDISNTYWIRVGTLTANSPEYIQPSTRQVSAGTDMIELLERLRRHPDVEAVSLSYNSFPYNGSWNGGDVTVDTLKQFGRKYLVTPDFLRVFRYQGINGETPEQLAALLKEETVIIGDNYFEEKGVSGRSLLNRFCKLNGDSLKSYRIAGVTKPVRFGDFVPASDSHYAMNFFGESWLAGYKESDVRYLEVCVRTHANCAPGFIERLRQDADKQFRVGNLLFEDIRSMQDIRRSFQLDDMNDFRNQLWGIGFLLLNIFMGLLGTFWFRTQQRRSEIALHLSVGSNRKQIFVRLLSEGLLLLVTATAVALIIDLNVAYMEYTPLMDEKVMTVPRFLITVGTTLLLMALTIVGGIWIPARQAMKIQPAVALREE